jgi:hypothetical protein
VIALSTLGFNARQQGRFVAVNFGMADVYFLRTHFYSVKQLSQTSCRKKRIDH